MHTFHFVRLAWVEFTRYLFTCLSIIGLVLVTGAAGAAAPQKALGAGNSAAALACADNNCVYLPSINAAYRCFVGQTIPDETNDVSAAHVDVTSLTSTFSGTSLTVTFQLRDLPPTLIFNRVGVQRDYLEYSWAVHVDTDNNPATGYPYDPYRGEELLIAADHFVSTSGTSNNLPIQNGVQANTWIYDSSFGGWTFGNWANLTVNADANTLQMTGTIPGLNANSRLMFEAYDYNPGGSSIRDLSYCSGSDSLAPGMQGQDAFRHQLSPDGLLKIIR